MALEITTAIVGLLAAAGKVAETLGPMVSAFLQAPKHAQTILTELQHTQTILSGLKQLTGKLESSPSRRRELIQLDQVVTATTDGVLLFDELEELIDRVGQDLKGSTRSRIKWARYKNELGNCASRLSSFKVSIGLMLNILQCDLDVDAQRDRDQLLANISTLLAQNLELAGRMEHLEGYYHAGNPVLTNRPTSRLSNATIIPASEHARLGGISSTLSPSPLTSSQAAQYEQELEVSRVYRKAQGGVDEISVRKSFAISHARSAFSNISLSDISALSVVALPVLRTEITNAYHYSPKICNECRPGFDPFFWDLQTPESRRSIERSLTRSLEFLGLQSQAGSRPSQQKTIHVSTQLKLVIIGTTDADIYALVAKLANRGCYDIPGSFTDQVVITDGLNVHLDIQTVNDLSSTTNIGIWNEHLRLGHMFMLVYSATSRTSFEKIARYQRLISRYKETAWFPMMVVGNHADVIERRQVFPYEGSAQALSQGSLFNEVSGMDSVDDLHQMFCDVVRLRWKFEIMDWDILHEHWRACSEQKCEMSHRKLFGQLLEAHRNYERDAREVEEERARAEARRAQTEKDEARRKQHFEATQRTSIKNQESAMEVRFDTCAVNEAQRKARDEYEEKRYEQTKQKLVMLKKLPSKFHEQ